MTDLQSLISRLESAKEGSAELDLEIWNAVSPDAPWRFCDRPNEVITCDRYGAGATSNPIVSLDQFSRSLDAALTLVPLGYSYTVSSFPENKDWDSRTPYASACVWVPGKHEIPVSVSGEVATAPIALCLACLKASIAQQEGI